MSRHLSTRNISSKSMDVFLSNLAHRQTDKWTRQKHIPPPLSEVKYVKSTNYNNGNNNNNNIIIITATMMFIVLIPQPLQDFTVYLHYYRTMPSSCQLSYQSPTNFSHKSACRLLLSTLTIAAYNHYSAQKLVFILGMLNDNRIIDYRNLFSFSFLHYRFSKCDASTALTAAESAERSVY